MNASAQPPLAGRILIVDDDPVVAGMLGMALADAGHEVFAAHSGEAALAQLATLAAKNSESLPDIVFLDIEMGNTIDGYETCRRLRANNATNHLPVIFLSSHDEPNDRLCAYDAGGSDFMAKPFVSDEVLRKAALAISHKRRMAAMAVENRLACDEISSALTGLDDSGVTLKFNRGALGCRTLRALAALTIEAMDAFGIQCHVQLRTPSETLTRTAQGPASPLEESVIEISKTMDRMFSFGNRLIVNYDSISLLVTNMPIANEALCGRIRDQAATIADAADLAIGNINLRTDAVMRAAELSKLAEVSRKAVEELRGNYHERQAATRLEFEGLVNSIEGMYVHLGLTNHQELSISDTVRNSVERVLELFEGGNELDRNFAGIVDGLTKAGEYTVTQEDEAQLKAELW